MPFRVTVTLGRVRTGPVEVRSKSLADGRGSGPEDPGGLISDLIAEDSGAARVDHVVPGPISQAEPLWGNVVLELVSWNTGAGGHGARRSVLPDGMTTPVVLVRARAGPSSGNTAVARTLSWARAQEQERVQSGP